MWVGQESKLEESKKMAPPIPLIYLQYFDSHQIAGTRGDITSPSQWTVHRPIKKCVIVCFSLSNSVDRLLTSSYHQWTWIFSVGQLAVSVINIIPVFVAIKNNNNKNPLPANESGTNMKQTHWIDIDLTSSKYTNKCRTAVYRLKVAIIYNIRSLSNLDH